VHFCFGTRLRELHTCRGPGITAFPALDYKSAAEMIATLLQRNTTNCVSAYLAEDYKRFFKHVCCCFVMKLEKNKHRIIVNLMKSDTGTLNLLRQVREYDGTVA
jgi:hypothetical protein